jgi:hypothetical protein
MILNRPWPFVFIGVGRTCPTRNSSYKSNPITTPWFGSDARAPVRPVRHTGLTGVVWRTNYRNQDWSDRPKTPVRPAWSARCQIWVSTYAPLVFWQRIRVKKYFSKLKSIRTMVNKTMVVHILTKSRMMPVSVSTPSGSVLTWLVSFQSAAPLSLACVAFAISFFECGTSLRDTTSAVST